MDREITKKNEIVSLLNQLRLKHTSVSLYDTDDKEVVKGFISKADTNQMSLLLDAIPRLIPLKNLNLQFEYNNGFYYSPGQTVRILNTMVKSLELTIPEKVNMHLIRKFTRVPLEDNKVRLSINSITPPEGAAPSKSDIDVDELPANLKRIYLELMENEPDLKKVLLMVGEELRRYSPRFRTNIFKDTQNLAPLEKVVYVYKKTFWISDTENLNNYVHLGGKYNLIGYEKYFEMINKKVAPNILEQIRANYLNRGVGSYCLVPVLIGDRVAGVIEVSVPEGPAYKKLSIYDIFYIKGLADILGEVVVKSRGVGDESDFEVLDISLGGVLALTKNVYLTRSFVENSLAELSLHIGEEEIKIPSRVVRCEYVPGDEGGLNVAFEFLAVGNEERGKIGKFIRGYLQDKIAKEKEVEVKK